MKVGDTVSVVGGHPHSVEGHNRVKVEHEDNRFKVLSLSPDGKMAYVQCAELLMSGEQCNTRTTVTISD